MLQKSLLPEATSLNNFTFKKQYYFDKEIMLEAKTLVETQTYFDWKDLEYKDSQDAQSNAWIANSFMFYSQ